jgi:hypothetical protein
MCRRVTCTDCEKPDWQGCGAHVEAVLGDVPAAERCKCREDGTRKARPGLLGALFGKR